MAFANQFNHRPPASPSTISIQTSNSRYLSNNTTRESLVDKFSLDPDPHVWGSALSPGMQEADDTLHNPDPKRDRRTDHGGQIFTARGITNLGCIAILVLGMLALFVGYPISSLLLKTAQSKNGGFNLGGLNASGQVPLMAGNWGLIDVDTPKDKYFIPGFHNPKEEMQLVFSDEFNKDGRTFYPGDDPYWEAYDMNYWVTKNLEWYDPSRIITKGGNLEISLLEIENHGLSYMGGMMTTWNKFCFTGGILIANVVLPGANNVAGLWPALWSMGNLGRAGYGATVDGMWPYSYDSCDVGTTPNQTFRGQPAIATERHNDGSREGALSYLPGQRLSRCTCEGESHPGPVHADGTYVGRSAPEIDVFEAQVVNEGHVSQSAQWAPFNDRYFWFNTTENASYGPKAGYNIYYQGGAYQQTTSSFTLTNPECYELESGCFATYGFEYKAGFDGAYIAWISEDVVDWTLYQAGLAADPQMQMGPRPIPLEPMYLIVNLGISEAFGAVDYEHLTFPTTMLVDWIRVYQPKNAINVGCDPPEFPTQAYINRYIEAYTNVNLTTWVDDYKQPIPKNRFMGECQT